jgi:DNA-binding response OmpR family regulator
VQRRETRSGQPRVSRGLRHVLVVEDDSPIRLMLADLLADAGYTVAEAIDGFEALEHVRERRPDLIVLDLMMPGMSGWEFLERSRGQLERANVPVIVLSAIRGVGDYPATLGVAAWFTKPLEVKNFLNAVEQLAGPSHTRAGLGATDNPTTPSTILLIEDDPDVGEVIGEFLAHQGFDVEVASTIELASARINRDPPQLILLDLMLPGATGWDFLRRRQVERALAAIPVLVVSAAPQDRLMDAKELGADGYLSKPFDFDVLTALVRSFTR